MSDELGPVRILPSPPQPETLGTCTTAWTACQYGPAAARRSGESRMILTVRPDPDDLQTTGTARLHYEAKLYLRDSTSVPILPATEVGQIQSYRLSKATEILPRTIGTISRMPWVRQFLQPEQLPEDGELIDMCLLLQSLYSRNGLPFSAPTLRFNHAVRADLGKDSLVYLKLVFIDPAYQGQRLGRTLFNSFYKCLRELPECESETSFAFI